MEKSNAIERPMALSPHLAAAVLFGRPQRRPLAFAAWPAGGLAKSAAARLLVRH